MWTRLRPYESLEDLMRATSLMEECVCLSLGGTGGAYEFGPTTALVRVFNDVAVNVCKSESTRFTSAAMQTARAQAACTLLCRALVLVGVPAVCASQLLSDPDGLTDGTSYVPSMYHKVLSITCNNLGCVFNK